jgi:hypothetical protein
MTVFRTSGQRAWLLAAIVLALIVAVLNQPPASAAQFNQGLQDGWAVGDQGQTAGGQLLSDLLGSIQTAGAGWVRVNFRLGACFSDWTSIGCNGHSAIQTYDQVVTNVQAKNLKVLGLLTSEAVHGQQSDWTANNAEISGGNGSNTYVGAFASVAGTLATHYNGTNGPTISQWEVWNEPNAWTTNPMPGVYMGGSFMYPSNFAALLTQVGGAITAPTANPSDVVVSGGILGLDPGGHGRSGLNNGYKAKAGTTCPTAVPSGGDYLCATYDMGREYDRWVAGHSPFNAVGQHLYINQSGTTTGKNISTYLSDLRTVYEAYGGEPATLTTHVTEFGWTTGSVSTNTQAKNLQTTYQTLKGTSFVARAYWYRTQDLGVANDYYGLLTTNGVQKPAFSAYQRYAAY